MVVRLWEWAGELRREACLDFTALGGVRCAGIFGLQAETCAKTDWFSEFPRHKRRGIRWKCRVHPRPQNSGILTMRTALFLLVVSGSLFVGHDLAQAQTPIRLTAGKPGTTFKHRYDMYYSANVDVAFVLRYKPTYFESWHESPEFSDRPLPGSTSWILNRTSGK